MSKDVPRTGFEPVHGGRLHGMQAACTIDALPGFYITCRYRFASHLPSVGPITTLCKAAELHRRAGRPLRPEGLYPLKKVISGTGWRRRSAAERYSALVAPLPAQTVGIKAREQWDRYQAEEYAFYTSGQRAVAFARATSSHLAVVRGLAWFVVYKGFQGCLMRGSGERKTRSLQPAL
jgi:hypothetical protein